MFITSKKTQDAVPIHAVKITEWKNWLHPQPSIVKNQLITTDFQPKAGAYQLIHDEEGYLRFVIVVYDTENMIPSFGHLPTVLPTQTYYLEENVDRADLACVAWLMGAYQFTNYKKAEKTPATLVLPANMKEKPLEYFNSALTMTRDLINTPAADLTPEKLAKKAKDIAFICRTATRTISGTTLKTQFPAVHAVGKGSENAPRMIDLEWGKNTHPRLTIIGKGVCFDTGGLDIKPASGMLTMKKDMGGAAHALALSQWIMQEKLPVRLRTIVPAVENSVSGSSFRPSDIIDTRKGLTVEIGNTDAEGRLILADALTLASEDKPELVIDFATLTGACRVAMGTDIVGLFTNRDELARDIIQAGNDVQDPIWQLPLYQPYKTLLKSPIADLNNMTNTPYGGAIAAALFLEHFIDPKVDWVHLDLMAWNSQALPGRPKGGEAQGLRAIFHYLQQRYSNDT
ncbi:MAG: cytosol aminopeptidase [marine bacterium B5-7]|nr:MAG: cytosol aminopeptidase [marine bacterium B5-7]